MGVVNARLTCRQPGEEHMPRPFVYNPTDSKIADMSEEVQDNRRRFMDAVGSANVNVMNTWFQKPQTELLAHRPPGIEGFNEDVVASNYARIDHVVATKKMAECGDRYQKRYTHHAQFGSRRATNIHERENDKAQKTARRVSQTHTGDQTRSRREAIIWQSQKVGRN
jgi:hypothetical protein